MTLVASGTAGAWGIRAVGGSPVVEECTIRAQGSQASYNLVGLGGASRPAVKRTVMEATGGSIDSRGMSFLDTSVPAEIRDVQVKVSGASSNTYGVYIDDYSFQAGIRITSSTFDFGGTGINTGIWFRGLQLNVEQSQVRATGPNSRGILLNFTGPVGRPRLPVAC